MDKAKITMIGIVGLFAIFIVLVLMYVRGFDINTSDVSIQLAGEEQTTTVDLKGDDSTIRTIETDSTEVTRALKSYEIESVEAALDKLRVRWGAISPEKACDSGSSSSLTINDGNSRIGNVYFCEGIGVDEEGNILGPYHDLMKIVDELSVDTPE